MGWGEKVHHNDLDGDHHCNSNIECAESGWVSGRFAGDEKVRCHDLAGTVGHEHHDLRWFISKLF
jgi:hypothetical protein